MGTRAGDVPVVATRFGSLGAVAVRRHRAWFDAGVIDDKRVWTSAAGAYAGNVAEHTMMLLLAGVRSLPEQLAAQSWRKEEFDPRVGTLQGSTVAIIGCGGIGRALIPYLAASRVKVIAITRSGTPVEGASETLSADRTGEIWSKADHFVIAAPSTSATRHLVGKAELDQMSESSWIVNIARGTLVDTDALVDALEAGSIGGAALDVTDPEPLPDGIGCGSCPTRSSLHTSPTRLRRSPASWQITLQPTSPDSPQVRTSPP